MTVVQWRQFTFFERNEVVDNEDSSQSPQWLQDLEITASTNGRGHLFFGDATGAIIILNHALSVVFSFQAHDRRVTHLKHMKYRNQLVSIGEDESGIPIVKVWNLDKPDKAAKTPILQRSSKIQYGHKVFPVTALAVLENMTQVAIGLENGVVVLIRGDISRDRFTKSKIIHEGSEMITGLGFCEDGKSTRLYIVTLARILTCDTSNKDLKQALDDQGGEIGAVILTAQETNQEIVIGRQEAVYFYGLDGRGPCFVIDGEKTSLSWFRNYLVVVTRESRNATAPTSALADYMGGTGNDADTIIHASPSETTPGTVLTLYDLKNKYVAFTGTLSGSGYRGQPIRAVLGEWGELFIVTEDRKMYRLQEKDMDTKLDILFKKNMYTLAINLVMSTQSMTSADATDEDPASVTKATTNSEYDFGTVVEIYKRYGDWLYSKGDYDAAIQQYLHTIGQLEPSYVIRKFLDAQRIHNLTSYLQALHEQNLANADHTTLLLNCYTKLKDVQRLDEFVKTDRELKFDVETAIRVCRQGGYHEHALWLAKKFGEHEWYMRIQLEDLKQYSETVEYLSELEPREAVRSLGRYGYILVTEKPSEMTEVLLKLCSEPLASGAQEQKTAALPEDVIHLYVNRAEWCVRFLERILERRWGVIIGGKGKGPATDTPDKVQLDSSQDVMDKDAESKRIVCNTLLELYLGAGQQSTLTVTDENSANEQAQMESVDETTRLRWRNHAFDLLRSPSATYDLDHALVLCKMHSFGEGILYVYERLALHKDILQQHMDAEDYSSIIATCKTYGDQDPSLWTHALAYFAEKGTGLGGPNPQEDLLEVLDNIDRRNLLPPLQVIQVLARNSAVTIEMVRDYIVRRVEAEKKAIDESQKLIASYREETERMRGQIEELKTSPIVFQVTKCELCRHSLELPTVHFLCKHSYHQRCLGDADQECPRCAPEHRMIQDLVRSQEANAGRHEIFMHKLEASDDRFAIIAEWFSKNAFATARLTD
ncbi:tethering complex subunit PEP5 [Spizellomyces punctatus DAOM BR117]|uniref:E3 ubiquitin-protein ligase PEP5 n=1 Tax=Spizellomyces punctatus (strain DAOM BR117) TaxID=645134 RepID=A0A0L0HC64_SPIPD|nr:tethering complex subunit PEP5 [Spizellomyces punctatus DAOM BR117]KNC99120.1 hypothetical protein SPPG_05379 [Spizellomyces punctatus DAOM BR117]|eukprot:XP_016607160.1 hypothetical protein SPPG_05379 [Spizellomyces punctatus DAOM BR117]